MKSLNIKVKLTIWFMVIFLLLLFAFSFSMYIFISSGLKENIEKQLTTSLSTVDNLIASSVYDPFDLAHIGNSDMFKIMDDERTLCTSRLWEQNKLDSLPFDEINRTYKIRDNYYCIKKSDASKAAVDAIIFSVDTFQLQIQHGDTSLLKRLNRIQNLNLHHFPSAAKGKIHIMVAKDFTAFQKVKISYLKDFFESIPIILIVLLIGGYITTRRFLFPLSKMAAKAQAISAEHLAERLPVKNPNDEFGKLATVFNNTLARLQDSFDKLHQFTANVSHELRTPLTAIKSVGEVVLREEDEVNKYRDAIGSMLEETDRLKCLIDKLLLLSRADAGKITTFPEKVEINELIRNTADVIKVLAEEKNIGLQLELNGKINVLADIATIRQAFVNILDNAIRYTPENSFITIATGSLDNDHVYIDVIDQGPGIPLKERSKIFDRFYRLDNAQSKGRGGNGLGLAITKWAVEINKGTIQFIGEEPKGSHCRITLPLHLQI
jgi:heavy metal sensor kinase